MCSFNIIHCFVFITSVNLAYRHNDILDVVGNMSRKFLNVSVF